MINCRTIVRVHLGTYIENVNIQYYINDSDRLDQHAEDEPLVNDEITTFEKQKSVHEAKAHKTSAFDNIPSEVFKNDAAVSVSHILFNQCFKAGKITTDWGKGIINPIPKSSTLALPVWHCRGTL